MLDCRRRNLQEALRLLRAVTPSSDAAAVEELVSLGRIEELASLGRVDPSALRERLRSPPFSHLKLGQRKRLELSLRAVPLPPFSVMISEELVPLALRIAWLRSDTWPCPGSLILEDEPASDRHSVAAAVVAGGVLLR